MNINKILFDRYKRDFFIKDITGIIKIVNDNYMSEMSDEVDGVLSDGWIQIDFSDTNVLKENYMPFPELSLQKKLSNTKDMLSKALLEEEYQLATELKKLIDDIENEINNS